MNSSKMLGTDPRRDTIVLSSTNADLRDYRNIALRMFQEFDFAVSTQEYETPNGRSPAAEFSQRLVDEATCYVGIVAWRYGCIPPGGEKSVTELEYERAVERGIPRFVFVLQKGIRWPEDQMDLNRESVARFRDRLSKELVHHFFCDENDFALKLKTVLFDQIQKRFREEIVAEVRRNERFRRALYRTESEMRLTYRDIEKITRLKGMHDCLHTIRQECVNVIYDQVMPLLELDGSGSALPEPCRETVEHAFNAFRRQREKLSHLIAEGGGDSASMKRCLAELERLEVRGEAVTLEPQLRKDTLCDLTLGIEAALTDPFSSLNWPNWPNTELRSRTPNRA